MSITCQTHCIKLDRSIALNAINLWIRKLTKLFQILLIFFSKNNTATCTRSYLKIMVRIIKQNILNSFWINFIRLKILLHYFAHYFHITLFFKIFIRYLNILEHTCKRIILKRNFIVSDEKGHPGKMAIVDVVLNVFRAVLFLYDVVTFPIYAIAQQKWKDRTKQDLGKVSLMIYFLIRFILIKINTATLITIVLNYKFFFRLKMLPKQTNKSRFSEKKEKVAYTKKSLLELKWTPWQRRSTTLFRNTKTKIVSEPVKS